MQRETKRLADWLIVRHYMVLCPDSELNCPVTGTGNTIFWTVAHTLTARYTHLPQNTFVVAHPEIKFMTINDLATVVPQASLPQVFQI